jgi:hypothetical protein
MRNAVILCIRAFMDEEGLYAMVNCYVAPLALRSRYGSAGRSIATDLGQAMHFRNARPPVGMQMNCLSR